MELSPYGKTKNKTEKRKKKMSLSFRLSLNSPQMSILVIKSYIEPPKYSSVLQLNLLYANRSDSEVAWQFLLTSPSLSSLPVTAS